MEDKFLTIENGVYEYGKEMMLESNWKYQCEIWSNMVQPQLKLR